MMRWLRRIWNSLPVGSRPDEASPEEAEALRTAFKDRYHHFKLLLDANHQALEIMAEIEEALRGGRPFGMTFVRGRSTRVSTHVFRMIRGLVELAPDKGYGDLFERFKEIQKRINPHVYPQGAPLEGAIVIPFKEIDRRSVGQTGLKIAGLGELRRLGAPVTDGFAVTAAGYRRFMEHNDLAPEIDRRLQAAEEGGLDRLFALSAELQGLIARAGVPDDLAGAMTAECRRLDESLGGGITLAIRSSALGEDAAGTTFAGQYRSALNVAPENLLEAYKEIVASKYGLSAMAYRLNRGIRDEDVAMCVGCQPMVAAKSGGVLYTRDPLDFEADRLLIHAAFGLPKSVVDGSVAPDLFVVRRSDPPALERSEIARKDHRLDALPEEGLKRVALSGAEGTAASLTREEAVELAKIALRIEAHYGGPQDLEWILTPQCGFIVLQCRPLEPAEGGAGSGTGEASEPGGARALLEGGRTASPGAACGPAFLVRKEADALRFPEGAILVAEQALPRWAPLLSRAAGVVTEQGSIASHLANVAREFKVPALFGAAEAADRLPEGGIVTLDADAGRVYEGKVEGVLGRPRPHRNLMEGSPVFASLAAAAEHIVPLNLLDPDAPEFAPANCRTFHDITRFSHEKAVQEMFRFGKDHSFPERSGKQLHYKVPMQWWILNLDDGFEEEVQGKYVRIEQIASVPMLAFWEGLLAVPWEGPPPIDRKGLMSVMFETVSL